MESDPRKLPLRHPQYRYPPSTHPYAPRLAQEHPTRAYADLQTESHRGEWRTCFPDAQSLTSTQRDSRTLHVEIGCNGGHVILEWAKLGPKDAWIGIDWKYKQIHRGSEKAEKRGLNNLLFFRAHADRLEYMFAPGEIDRLYLYFPDPWAKKSQWKNRTVNPQNLKIWASLVKPGGLFHIKTDHSGYFDWMLDAIAQVPEHWRIEEQTRDLHHGHPDPKKLEIPQVTLFEKVFIREGIAIKSALLRRI